MDAAAQDGHCNVVKMLLEGGVDVNVKSKSGTTPLHLAAKNDRLTVVRELFI
jgi:ankyrin repeat protein